MNKRYFAYIGIAVVIGISVSVYGYLSMNTKGTGTDNSVSISDNIQVAKTPANTTAAGKHFTVQLTESMGVSSKP